MSVKFKNGDKVRQVVQAPIEGTVVKFVFDETEGTISYVVRTSDEQGDHERVFTGDQIEALPVA